MGVEAGYGIEGDVRDDGAVDGFYGAVAIEVDSDEGAENGKPAVGLAEDDLFAADGIRLVSDPPEIARRVFEPKRVGVAPQKSERCVGGIGTRGNRESLGESDEVGVAGGGIDNDPGRLESPKGLVR